MSRPTVRRVTFDFTPRERERENARQTVLDGRLSPILKRNDATRCRSACMRLSHLALRGSETRDFEFVPLKSAARYLVGKPTVALRFRRQKTCGQDHSLRGPRLCWRPSLEEEQDATCGTDWEPHLVKSGSTLQSLTALSVGETENSLTNRLGAGQQTKHIDTRYFWIQERVQDGDFSIKMVLTAKNCADVGTNPVSGSVLQQHCKFAGLVFY